MLNCSPSFPAPDVRLPRGTAGSLFDLDSAHSRNPLPTPSRLLPSRRWSDRAFRVTNLYPRRARTGNTGYRVSHPQERMMS